MRARRIAYRCCLAAWIATFAAWTLSTFVCVTLVTSSFAIMVSGGVIVVNTMTQFFNAQLGVTVEIQPTELYWRFAFTQSSVGNDVMVPIWPLIVVLTIVTLILGRRVRRARVSPGHCPKCGYDVRASNSGVCSECGAKIPVAVPAASG